MAPETQSQTQATTENGQTQTPANGEIEIRTRVKNVLDLDSKESVPVVKVGKFVPVKTMEEFVQRLGNDSALILKVVNDGMEEFAKEQLESDANTPFMAFDDEGKLVPASSNLLIFGTDEKEKSFGATVLNLAKTLFGYPDVPRGTKLSAEEAQANKAKKDSSKAEAIEMLLSRPDSIERLKAK